MSFYADVQVHVMASGCEQDRSSLSEWQSARVRVMVVLLMMLLS